MDTLKRLHEHISALADGELTGQEAQQAVAALAGPEAGAAWRAYHLIGDVLRSDASGAELGEGFNARLAARLDVEVPPSPGRVTPASGAAPAAAPAAGQPARPAAGATAGQPGAAAPAAAPVAGTTAVASPGAAVGAPAAPDLAAPVPDTAI
ncbi:sigma-E factor negative regulatory protein [Massilia sp. Root351]|jgi:sigma-E factor negative regulatory protein RseA|uniref:sigma-E factor negative regulatory protein n=1 Tax=Massilia sp. Root351 TaxID=1736522 RepID=UPI0009E717D8|nr:sigma-E factor negative regulatory protein [Massilia sp. Root351]